MTGSASETTAKHFDGGDFRRLPVALEIQHPVALELRQFHKLAHKRVHRLAVDHDVRRVRPERVHFFGDCKRRCDVEIRLIQISKLSGIQELPDIGAS